MEKWVEHIEHDKMSKAMAEYVREKAKAAGTQIIYLDGENIVAEDPTTNVKTIIKESTRKLKT